MRIDIDFDENSDTGKYLLTCARIRDISARSLVRRLVDVIAVDQMVSGVLDDSENIAIRKKSEHHYRGPKF